MDKRIAAYRGCLLGLAVGDAMGYTVDKKSWDEICENYGPNGLLGYDLVNGTADITSYTQLAAFLCNGLLLGAIRGNPENLSKYMAMSLREWVKSQQFRGSAEKTACWLAQVPEMRRRHCMDTRILDTLRRERLGTLEMPVFYFNSSCVLTIENLDPQLHYEIRSGGNSLGVYMAREMENYFLPWGESISIRSLDPATGATSPWTPEQMTHPTESMGSAGAPPAQGSQDPSLPQLPAPKLSIGATGLITVEADENAAFIRLVDTATGEDMSYWEDFENRAKPGSVLVAYALGDGVRYRDSEASEAVAFDAETVTFSLTENPLSGATENPDGSMTLIAYSNRGNAYEFRIEGEVTQTPEGWGLLASGSAIYNVDAMHGIFATICPEGAVSAHMLSWGCGYMLDEGATTFWETMAGWKDFQNAGSLCHGWSALAAYYYRRLLR